MVKIGFLKLPSQRKDGSPFKKIKSLYNDFHVIIPFIQNVLIYLSKILNAHTRGHALCALLKNCHFRLWRVRFGHYYASKRISIWGSFNTEPSFHIRSLLDNISGNGNWENEDYVRDLTNSKFCTTQFPKDFFQYVSH